MRKLLLMPIVSSILFSSPTYAQPREVVIDEKYQEFELMVEDMRAECRKMHSKNIARNISCANDGYDLLEEKYGQTLNRPSPRYIDAHYSSLDIEGLQEKLDESNKLYKIARRERIDIIRDREPGELTEEMLWNEIQILEAKIRIKKADNALALFKK